MVQTLYRYSEFGVFYVGKVALDASVENNELVGVEVDVAQLQRARERLGRVPGRFRSVRILTLVLGNVKFGVEVPWQLIQLGPLVGVAVRGVLPLLVDFPVERHQEGGQELDLFAPAKVVEQRDAQIEHCNDARAPVSVLRGHPLDVHLHQEQEEDVKVLGDLPGHMWEDFVELQLDCFESVTFDAAEIVL